MLDSQDGWRLPSWMSSLNHVRLEHNLGLYSNMPNDLPTKWGGFSTSRRPQPSPSHLGVPNRHLWRVDGHGIWRIGRNSPKIGPVSFTKIWLKYGEIVKYGERWSVSRWLSCHYDFHHISPYFNLFHWLFKPKNSPLKPGEAVHRF